MPCMCDENDSKMNLLLRESALEHCAEFLLARKRISNLLIALQQLQNGRNQPPLSEIDQFVLGDVIGISILDEGQIAQINTTGGEEAKGQGE